MDTKSEIDKMYERVQKFSDSDLCVIWEALRHYNPSEDYAPGITMDTWTNAIYSECSRRGLL